MEIHENAALAPQIVPTQGKRYILKICTAILLLIIGFFFTPPGRVFAHKLAMEKHPVFCILAGGFRDDACPEYAKEKQAVRNKDVTICFTLSSDRDCIERVAEATGNEDLCKYQDVYSDIICREKARGTIAVKNKDVTICDAMTYPATKSQCYGRVGVALEDSALCDIATEDPWARETCLHDLALKTKNFAYCDKIGKFGNSHAQDSCIAGLSEQENDVRGCTSIQDRFSLAGCFNRIKKATNGDKACSALSPDKESFRDQCLGNSNY